MEFWGLEVKPGKPIKVEQEDGYVIHVSHISLGDFKKVGDKTVQVYVKSGDAKQKLLIGNLSQKIPQVSLDLMFEQDFEISHECKSASVFFLGFKTVDAMDGELNSDFDSEDEDIPMDMFKSELEKSKALNDKKANESDDEDESDSVEMGSDEAEDDSEEEEDTPVKVEPPSKKRPNGGAKNNNKSTTTTRQFHQRKPKLHVSRSQEDASAVNSRKRN